MNTLSGFRLVRWLEFAFKRILRAVASKESIQALGSQQEGRDLIEAVYVINLDRQPSRWKKFMCEARRLATRSGDNLLCLCHRVSAIDGRSLVKGKLHDSVSPSYPLKAQYYVDPDPRLLVLMRDATANVPMSREEIAVALSHIGTWRRIVAESRSYAMVLEDDVFFERDFPGQLNRSWLELPRGDDGVPTFDLLYLSFREVERGAERRAYSANLFRPIRGYWWLSGYVLSNAGARKLLDALPVVGPVDLWMNHRFPQLEVFSVPESVISQRTDLQSDNRYSILPLLSQIGVQSDGTHELLEQTRGRCPVFCVGFERDSAGILETALSLLGYRCCHDRWGQISGDVEQLIENNMPMLFDSYIGVRSVSKALVRICQLYPDSAVMVPQVPQVGSEVSLEEYWEVRKRFEHDKGRLWVLDGQSLSGWSQLCKFLGCKRPRYPFPANEAPRPIDECSSQVVERRPIAKRRLTVLEHDVHPWIVPYQRLPEFGVQVRARTSGTQIGMFNSIAADSIGTFDESRWTALDGSFPSNRAVFRPQNLTLLSPRGFRMTLGASRVGDREYVAASVKSKQSYEYGRFEAVMKPGRAPGVVTAFFLHRNDPWQEIDVELLGKDTTKLLLNVYFNPGNQGTQCNFGTRGTPTVIDLAFDAADDYHSYAIEWEPHEVRWLVDDHLVHARGVWEPTPVPNLPMDVYCSIWPPKSVELFGQLRDSDLPVSSEVRGIEVFEWQPNHEGTKQQHV